jgi:HSP20 family protein
MTLYISPYRRLSNLRQQMDRLFEEEFESTPSEREMMLALDVVAQDDDYLVRALVPGLNAEDVNIEILNNTVSIRGEFKGEEKEGAKFLMNELPSGRFARVIARRQSRCRRGKEKVIGRLGAWAPRGITIPP